MFKQNAVKALSAYGFNLKSVLNLYSHYDFPKMFASEQTWCKRYDFLFTPEAFVLSHQCCY